jgi:hypothetical protein
MDQMAERVIIRIRSGLLLCTTALGSSAATFTTRARPALWGKIVVHACTMVLGKLVSKRIRMRKWNFYVPIESHTLTLHRMTVSPSLVSTSDTSEPHIHAFRYKVRDFRTRRSRASVDDSVWTASEMTGLLTGCSSNPGCAIWPDSLLVGAVLLVSDLSCTGSTLSVIADTTLLRYRLSTGSFERCQTASEK